MLCGRTDIVDPDEETEDGVRACPRGRSGLRSNRVQIFVHLICHGQHCRFVWCDKVRVNRSTS